ncbi:rho-related GTP-binding protein RhoD [Coturnix japonica]|uniref:rho-related GTP-binding protein RhoD n=1 Tax=Coturnix japonica TaxID=93934 RepID=UPI0013A5C77C|nr:rho-related GTP-binding protein RhoD [Coturnix japonica]
MQPLPGSQSSAPGPSEPTVAEIKAVVVGDGGCGKTSLLMVFARGDFPKVYVPTVFEKYTASFRISGKPAKIHLWDTAGQEDYDRLRPLSYQNTNVVLICFDVTSRSSYDNILTKWYPEVNHFCKDVPVLLVGCKTDLRQGHHQPVTFQEGEAMARQVQAAAYLECSALQQDNVRDVFIKVCTIALRGTRRPRRKNWPRNGCVLC